MKHYLVTMGVRTACFVLAFVTQGWVRVDVCGASPCVLPYIAVVFANARAPRTGRPLSVTSRRGDPAAPPARARDLQRQGLSPRGHVGPAVEQPDGCTPPIAARSGSAVTSTA